MAITRHKRAWVVSQFEFSCLDKQVAPIAAHGMFGGKQKAELESMADILADAKRYRDEAIKTLAAVNAGMQLAPGMTRDAMVKIITENIELYEKTLRQYEWMDDAPRP